MATFTSFLNLRKPATGDLVTVSTDINANMDLIDAELSDDETRLDAFDALNISARLTALENTSNVTLIKKPADESVTSSTALQNDDDFVFVFPSTGTYKIQGVLFLTGADTGDFKMGWTFTATLTMNEITVGMTVGSTTLSEFERIDTIRDANVSPSSTASFGTQTGNTTAVKVDAIVTVTAVGNIRLQWAQDASNATATVVKKGSFLTYQRIL